MKLRVRINRQTCRVDIQGEEPSLGELKDHIKENILSLHGLSADTEFSLSLNGSELLSDTGQTLSSCGIVSGDLICVILPESAAAAAAATTAASNAAAAAAATAATVAATAPAAAVTTSNSSTSSTDPRTSSTERRGQQQQRHLMAAATSDQIVLGSTAEDLDLPDRGGPDVSVWPPGVPQPVIFLNGAPDFKHRSPQSDGLGPGLTSTP